MAPAARFCLFLLVWAFGSIGPIQCLEFLPDLERFSQQLTAEVLPALNGLENKKCVDDTRALIEATRSMQMWAMQMLDASGKWNPGFLMGNIKSLGNFDQCVAVEEPRLGGVRGQYCTANVDIAAAGGDSNMLLHAATLGRRDREITMNRTHDMPVPDLLPSMSLVQFALCVPASCSARDVELVLNKVVGGTNRTISKAEIESCYAKNNVELGGKEIAFLLLVGFIIILVALSSTIECQHGVEPNRGFCYNSLMAFSLPTNWKRLVTISHSPTALNSLDGIRILSTLWVMVGHKVIYTVQEPWANKVLLLTSLRNLSNMPLINNMPSVDTFFLMSGMLRTYNLMKEFEGKRFDFFTDVARRFLRLTPVYALVIAFYATILPHLGSGPRWNLFVTEPAQACADNWQNNILYLNSYVHGNKHCMIHTWYLAADMQLFVASPLLVYLLWRHPAAGRILLLLAALVPMAYTAAYTFANEALPTYLLYNTDEKLIEYQRSVHITTHHRMAPYIVGIALGYLMSRHKNVTLPRSTVAAGWLVCLATLYAVVFGAYDLVQFDHPYGPIEAALYASLHRAAWSAGVAWLIFACNNGYGGWVTKILSLGIFQPLSKISYCIYLTHYSILMIGTGRIKSPLNGDEYFLFHDLMGDIVVSFSVATILYLAVEAPLFEITRLIFAKAKPAAPPKKLN